MDLVGRAQQALPEHLLDLADLRAVGRGDVVAGTRVEALTRLDPQDLLALRLVREEADVLLELEARLLDEREWRPALLERELVLVHDRANPLTEVEDIVFVGIGHGLLVADLGTANP